VDGGVRVTWTLIVRYGGMVQKFIGDAVVDMVVGRLKAMGTSWHLPAPIAPSNWPAQ